MTMTTTLRGIEVTELLHMIRAFFLWRRKFDLLVQIPNSGTSFY